MGKNKLLAGIAAGVLVTTVMAATASSTSAAEGGGNDLAFPLSNTNAITLPCGAAGACNAAPFPSNIAQFGMSTVITDVNVTLNNVSHTFPDDLDIQVMGPTGVLVSLMSDACADTDVVNRNFTFDDAAAGPLPENAACNASQTVDPSNYSDVGPEQWFGTPTAATLAAFNGTNPNGTWRLYAGDDTNQDTGGIAGGWSITITTAAAAPITIPAFGATGAGVAAPYPAPIAVTGKTGLMTDVNVTIPGLSHSFLGDLQVLLVSPTGKAVKLMANNCGNTAVLDKTFVFDDAAATSITAGGCANGGTFKPSTSALANMPVPAPAGPYGTSMADFNGASPNGQWSVYINDTAGADGGWIGAQPTLTIQTTDVIAPNTLLVGKKPENTTKTKVKIKFTSTEAGSTFKCKVDGKKYKPCTSPLKLKNLKVGKHKVLIVATDAAGNSDPKALKVKWKIFPTD